MNYDNIIQAAIAFATEAHKGQFRKDGKEYITHPIAVMNNALENYFGDEKGRMIISVVSLVHDIFEDVKKYEDRERTTINDFFDQFKKIGAFNETREVIIQALRKLNKNSYANYLDYIITVKSNSLATRIKLADLKHNMSDLAEGSLKDKYRLAEYILTHWLWILSIK